MPAKVANVLVYLIGAWLLSGRPLYSILLAGAIAGLSAVEYGWNTIQWVGVVLLVAAFFEGAGVFPYLPA